MAVSLDDIKNYTVIAKTLNITKASLILGLSQPALSYSLKRLERELGGDLCIRLKNGIALTKMGELYLQRSGQLIHYWESSKEILAEENVISRSVFKIGAHVSVANYSLVDIFDSIYKAYPSLSFDMSHKSSYELTNDILNWNLDFGIIVNPVAHLDLTIKQLGKDTVSWFRRGKCKNKLIYNSSTISSRKILKTIDTSSYGHIHTDSLEFTARLVSRGAGYGFLPARVASLFTGLKVVGQWPSFSDRICLVYRKEKHSNAISQFLLSKLREIEL